MAEIDPADSDPTLSEAVSSALEELRRDFLERLGSLERQIASELRSATAPEPEAPPTDSKEEATTEGIGPIVASARSLEMAASQTDMLTTLLEGAGHYARRVAFLVRRGDSLKSWGSAGFDGSEDIVGAADLSRRDVAEIDRCLAGDGSVAVGGDWIADRLGGSLGTDAGEGLLIPFVLAGEVAGALYADGRLDGGWDPDGLRLLTWLTARAIETHPGRNGSVTSLWSVADVEAPAETEEADAPASTLEIEAPSFALEEADTAADETPEAEASRDAAREPEVEDDLYAAETVALPADAVEESAVEESVVEEAPAEDGEAAEDPWQAEESAQGDWSTVALPRPDFARRADEVVRPPLEKPVGEPGSTEVRPPDDLDGPGWAFNAPGSESAADEARRLARLLVTEIKLYNQDKLDGAAEKDGIYGALREDIERSRRIFKERLGAEEAEQAQHLFREALVTILADGDESRLGD